MNKFVNGSFYRRISPTSFYALQTSAPNDTQAAAMMEQWLFNKDGFCIAEQGDFSGLDDTCYWGLPSIQASDPAYPPLGYVGSLLYDVSICMCLRLISLCINILVLGLALLVSGVGTYGVQWLNSPTGHCRIMTMSRPFAKGERLSSNR